MITRSRILPWGHAGDAGHAVFEFCPIYNWGWFLVEVSSSMGNVWDFWRTQPGSSSGAIDQARTTDTFGHFQAYNYKVRGQFITSA